MTRQKRTFLIIDDQKILRETLSDRLNYLFESNEIKTAASGKEGLILLENWQPDIIFMDLSMPELNGIATTKKVLSKYSTPKIIAFSMNDNDEMVNKMMKVGARGYILKTDDIEDFLIAVESVLSGQIFISKNIMKH